MFAFGYALQHALLNRTLGRDILPPLLVTFGLSIIIQNGLLEVFSADSQRLAAGAIETHSIQLGGGLAVGTIQLITFASAVGVIVALNQLFYRTELGRAFRATSDDPEIAQLMGIDNRHIFSLAMAVSMVVIAVSALYLGMRANFDPTIGPARLLYAFEAVIIGGLGQLLGHAGRRHHHRRSADGRRADQSGMADPGRAPRVPGRAGAAPARPLSARRTGDMEAAIGLPTCSIAERPSGARTAADEPRRRGTSAPCARVRRAAVLGASSLMRGNPSPGCGAPRTAGARPADA